MRRVLGVFVSVLVMTFASFAVQAGEVGTKEEAVAMVKKVQKFYKKNGFDALVKAVNSKDKQFLNKDLYVFIVSNKGVIAAHGVKPALKGVDFYNLKDVNGVYITHTILKTLKTADSGWVKYTWPNAKTKKLENKASYVENLGKGHYTGVGVYLGNK